MESLLRFPLNMFCKYHSAKHMMQHVKMLLNNFCIKNIPNCHTQQWKGWQCHVVAGAQFEIWGSKVNYDLCL